MDVLEAGLVVGFVGCFIGAAGLSAAEVSIVRLRRSEVLVEVERGEARSRRLLELIDDLPVVLNTILLLVLLLQVAAATISGFLAGRWFGGAGVTVSTIVTTTVLFVYAEAIPKTRAVAAPRRTALRSTSTIYTLARLFRPVVGALIRLAGLQSGAEITTIGVLTEAEIRALAKESAQAGEIAERDADLVNRSFTFNDRLVVDVMVPANEIVAMNASGSVTEALGRAISAGHQRLPVYRDSLDDIVGVVRLRDLAAQARKNPTPSTSAVMRTILRCRDNDPISDLLRRMQAEGSWMAVVCDEGGTLGLVTIEDIVAELVGEIAEA